MMSTFIIIMTFFAANSLVKNDVRVPKTMSFTLDMLKNSIIDKDDERK